LCEFNTKWLLNLYKIKIQLLLNFRTDRNCQTLHFKLYLQFILLPLCFWQLGRKQIKKKPNKTIAKFRCFGQIAVINLHWLNYAWRPWIFNCLICTLIRFIKAELPTENNNAKCMYKKFNSVFNFLLYFLSFNNAMQSCGFSRPFTECIF